MINFKDFAEIVTPFLLLVALIMAVEWEFKRKLRTTARKAKSRR